jgi:hypothetical protein
MINRALACSSALALCFTAAAALADDGKGSYGPSLVGTISGFAGAGSDNASVFGGYGRFTVPLTDDGRCDKTVRVCPPLVVRQFWSVQGDAEFQSYRWDYDPWNFAALTAHVTYNNFAGQLTAAPGTPGGNRFIHLPSWRIGGYIGAVDAEWETRLLQGGVEGQVYLGNNLQVDGRAGFHFADEDTIAHVYAAARYFINRNFYLEANAVAASFSWGDHAASVGLRGEYKFDRSPFALYAGLNLDTHSDGWSFHEARVGVRVLYGERSLMGDMIKGASLGQDLLRPVFLAD